MSAIAEAFVRLRADDTGFDSDLDHTIGNRMDPAGQKMGHRLMGGFGTALKVGAIAAGAGLVAGAAGFAKFIGDARESQAVARMTAAVLTSTGGAAHITAKGVSALATAISNKTGVDDEAVQSASNLLLTFTNVRNEVGKGNDVFNQATQAATDMAAALGSEPKAAAIQLGKALNDPIKGITALSKAGVSFTEQQKEQIKAMVESGDVLGAQKMVLAELGKEFGGAASAAHDPLDKLKVIAGNLSETIGTALLPMVDGVATALGGFVAQMIEGEGVGGVFADIVANASDKLATFGAFVRTDVVPALIQFGGFIRENVIPVIVNLADYITGTVVPVIANILGKALEGARAGFAIVAKAVADNRPELEKLGAALQAVAQFIVEKVVPVLGPILKVAFILLGTAISGTIKFVADLIDVFSALLSAAKSVWNGVADVVSGAVHLVHGAIDRLSDIASTVRGFFGDAKEAASDKVDDLVSLAKGIPHRISEAIGDLGEMMKRKGRAIIQGLIDGILDMLDSLGNVLGKVAGKIAGFLPGSPVKEGPLRVLNEGRAGKAIVEMLMGGMSAKESDLALLWGKLSGGALAAPTLAATRAAGSTGGQGGGRSVEVNYHAAPGASYGTEADFRNGLNRSLILAAQVV